MISSLFKWSAPLIKWVHQLVSDWRSVQPKKTKSAKSITEGAMLNVKIKSIQIATPASSPVKAVVGVFVVVSADKDVSKVMMPQED